MKHRRTLSFFLTSSLLAASSVGVPACDKPFDTSRPTSSVKTTLGEDVYAIFCDRVGASSLTEDLTGSSYSKICHKTDRGWESATVDTTQLPPVAAASDNIKEARRLSIAKVEAMARDRAELVEALDAFFPDVSIRDPFAAGSKVRLHEGLNELARRLGPLYDNDPTTPDGQGRLPDSTEALARSLVGLVPTDAASHLAASQAADLAFARIGARQGYLPLGQALGAMRPLLEYPQIRPLVQHLVGQIGAGGKGEKAFQNFLRVAQQELRTLRADPPQPALAVTAATLQPNRPRQKLEVLSKLLLLADDAYRAPGAESRFLTARDVRGLAMPADKVFLSGGPFSDHDGDGYADVDDNGQFVGPDGTPFLAPPPFATPGVLIAEGFTFDPATTQARLNGNLLYSYVDTSRLYAGSALRDLRPLVTPKGEGASSTMELLEGLVPMMGDRVAKTRSYPANGFGDAQALAYTGFDAASSALPDLVYAASQVLGAPEGDDYLGFLADLHKKHPETTARAAAMAFAIREESKKPAYDKATLADTSTFWDDMGTWVGKVTRVTADHYAGPAPSYPPRGLLADLTMAASDPALRKYLPRAMGEWYLYKDRVTFNPLDLNGPPLDLDTTLPLVEGKTFQALVDRAKPETGDNRSAFQRFAELVTATNHVTTCNKANTKLSIDKICGHSLPVSVSYPLPGQSAIGECDMFEVDEAAMFYLDSMLDDAHPRRARLNIKGGFLDWVTKYLDCGFDSALPSMSGIEGLTTHPTPPALARLMFFGAPSDKYGSEVTDLVPTSNEYKDVAITSSFLHSTTEPAGSSDCPKDARGVQTCATFAETLRGKLPNTLSLTEAPFLATHPSGCVGASCAQHSSGFVEGMRPIMTTFANYQYDPPQGDTCTPDKVTHRCPGELLFTELMGILTKHWPVASGSGLSNYEELMDWVVEKSDAIGTLAEMGPELRDQQYVSPRYLKGKTRSGLDVMTSVASFVFDADVDSKLGVTDRQGLTTAKANDSAIKPLSVFDLFAQAMRKTDARFAGPLAPKHGAFRSGRSDIIDQFMASSFDGTKGAWQNPAFTKVLPDLVGLVREQVNAQCPDRETTHACAWGRGGLADELTDVMNGPLFAAFLDLEEALRGDDVTRHEVETLLAYLLAETSDPDALATTVATTVDLLLVLTDDKDLAPALAAISPMAAPRDGSTPGVADTSLNLLQTLLDDHTELPTDQRADAVVDRYHVLEPLLRNLVTPVAAGKRAPLEVFLDVIGDIQRTDSSQRGALSPDDYRALASGVRYFLTDDYRGLEQFYRIVRGRNGD